MTSRLLVVENDPTDDARRLGAWLVRAGLDLVTVRPYAGDPVPLEPGGWSGVLVLGGSQHAFDSPDGRPGAPWFPALASLLRAAVAARVPTLGICLGGQLLAQALGGRVERSANGAEIGASLVAKRDAAAHDPLFAMVPFTPDVFQWHTDEIIALPPGAELLAASPRVPHQAFRVGDRAWGLQFHIECDADMLASWAAEDAEFLRSLGMDADTVLAGCAAVAADVEDTWRPFAERFAAIVMGVAGPLPLPVIEA